MHTVNRLSLSLVSMAVAGFVCFSLSFVLDWVDSLSFVLFLLFFSF